MLLVFCRDVSVLVKYHSTHYLDCGRSLVFILKGISKIWQEERMEVEQLCEAEVSRLIEFVGMHFYVVFSETKCLARRLHLDHLEEESSYQLPISCDIFGQCL